MKKTDLPGLPEVYRVADLWITEALRMDGSLFSPGVAVWTLNGLNDLHQRILGLSHRSRDSFMTKLVGGLAGASRPVIRLTAEVVFMHLLVAWKDSIGPERKRELINAVLSLSHDTTIPPRNSMLPWKWGLRPRA